MQLKTIDELANLDILTACLYDNGIRHFACRAFGEAKLSTIRAVDNEKSPS